MIIDVSSLCGTYDEKKGYDSVFKEYFETRDGKNFVFEGPGDNEIDRKGLLELIKIWKEQIYSINNNSIITKFKAIYFGAISQNKTNLKEVIEVFNNLGDKYELIICGDGDDIDYYKGISCKNIIFKGFIQKNDLKKIISECSVGIVPLRSRLDFTKAIPNKAIEYLSYGTPILSSLSGDSKKFIEKNKVGLFYKNKSELKNHILRIKTDHVLLEKLSKNASKVFLSKFDFSQNFQNIKNHFISLIEKN